MPPIKPKDVAARKEAVIPEPVFDAWNEAIAKAWNGHDATVKESVVVDLIVAHMEKAGTKLSRTEVYEQHLLDVEEAYRKAGWRVAYDKPAYNESYPATYKFTKATRGSD